MAIEANYSWQILALDRAAELIGEALRLARPGAADNITGVYEVLAGSIANEANDPSTAMSMLLSAVNRIDPTAHPRLAYVAGGNLALAAIRTGYLDSAMCAILQLRQRFAGQIPDIKTVLRSELAIAEIENARGQWREAEERLHCIREKLAAHQLVYDAAQVDLGIAELAAKRGRWPVAAHHAESAARYLAAAGSPREARAATRLLREAVAEIR